LPETILIKGGTIVDPNSSHNGSKKDILCKSGIITEIGTNLKPSGRVEIIDASGLEVCPGLFDMRSQLKDPGKEYKEDIESGARAAISGGFTGLLALPTSNPVAQSKSSIHYVLNSAKGLGVDIHPAGASTVDLKGEEISEMYDMHMAGALAFSNGDRPYDHTGVLMRALQYCQSFNGLIMSHAEDSSIAANGSVNESSETIGTGLKKRPALAEYVQIHKEIEVLRYTGGKLHFSHISTANALNSIKKAKEEGLHVTCDVSIWHLIFNDSTIKNFDSNLKVIPPLRSESDRLALIKGLQSGIVDAIVSDHNPQNTERKKVEFDYAAFGATSLQTMYAAYVRYLSKSIKLEQFITYASSNPRKILGLKSISIQEGQKANLIVLNKYTTWTLDQKSNQSKSNNSPFFNQELLGKCVFAYNNGLSFSFTE
jgi:dihydroorotase